MAKFLVPLIMLFVIITLSPVVVVAFSDNFNDGDLTDWTIVAGSWTAVELHANQTTSSTATLKNYIGSGQKHIEFDVKSTHQTTTAQAGYVYWREDLTKGVIMATYGNTVSFQGVGWTYLSGDITSSNIWYHVEFDIISNDTEIRLRVWDDSDTLILDTTQTYTYTESDYIVLKKGGSNTYRWAFDNIYTATSDEPPTQSSNTIIFSENGDTFFPIDEIEVETSFYVDTYEMDGSSGNYRLYIYDPDGVFVEQIILNPLGNFSQHQTNILNFPDTFKAGIYNFYLVDFGDAIMLENAQLTLTNSGYIDDICDTFPKVDEGTNVTVGNITTNYIGTVESTTYPNYFIDLLFNISVNNGSYTQYRSNFSAGVIWSVIDTKNFSVLPLSLYGDNSTRLYICEKGNSSKPPLPKPDFTYPVPTIPPTPTNGGSYNITIDLYNVSNENLTSHYGNLTNINYSLQNSTEIVQSFNYTPSRTTLAIIMPTALNTIPDEIWQIMVLMVAICVALTMAGRN